MKGEQINKIRIMYMQFIHVVLRKMKGEGEREREKYFYR